VQSEQRPDDEGPIGLEGLFDERDYEARLVLPLPRVWPRRVVAGLGLLAVAAAVIALLVPRGAAPATLPDPTPRPVAVSAGSKPADRRPPHHRAHHTARVHPSARLRTRKPSPQPARPTAPATEPPAQPPADTGGAVLPDPGGVDTLPAP
jgi:hypothetical protein